MQVVIIAILALTCVTLGAIAYVANRNASDLAERLEHLQFTSPYAHYLGRTVEVKVYAASRWERMVVVAVSWHGAVAVRPAADLKTRARWIRADLVPERVREVTEWDE